MGHGLYTQFTRSFPFFAEVGQASETPLVHGDGHMTCFFHPQGRDAYERRFEGREGMGRYYTGKFKKCYNCKQKGHTDKECPHPKVSICFIEPEARQ